VSARLSRVDELPAADVNPVVAKTVEEDQVPGLELISGYRCAVPVRLGGVVRQRDTDATVDVADEARAVEALWTRAAPAIRSTDMFQGNLDDVPAGLIGSGTRWSGPNGVLSPFAGLRPARQLAINPLNCFTWHLDHAADAHKSCPLYMTNSSARNLPNNWTDECMTHRRPKSRGAGWKQKTGIALPER
jgi:hypothetical protein